MFRKHHSSFRAPQKRSSALIITLAALLLVSAILLVFFDQTTLNRQISFSSAGQYRADVVAHTALDTIVGDLRNEIVAGSSNDPSYTSNSITIYSPTTNLTVVPYQEDLQGFTNLVAQSGATTNLWPKNGNYNSILGPNRSVAGNNTATNSFNDRYIDKSRWNKPGLLGDPGTGTTNKFPNAYNPPDWVLVTRHGAVDLNTGPLPAISPSTAGSGTLSDRSAANTNYVVGRYAYTIYNEGGLVDVNVAGSPSAAPADYISKRGRLSQIDLSKLLTDLGDTSGSTDAKNLLAWRNFASTASLTTYTNLVLTATNGFVTVLTPGDQAFVSRQDLIGYIKQNAKNLTQQLPYLTTFTRELNAPSYSPPPTTSTNRPPVKAGEGISAMGFSGKDDVFNPSLINMRVTTSFVRYSDGTTAQPGEPLIKYRFPLSRLAWVGYKGPGQKVAGTDTTPASAIDIANAFGLKQTTGPEGGVNWTYYTHDASGKLLAPASTILTLDQVATLGREPDFFELLQAGMFVGSLGKQAKNSVELPINALDSNVYYQVMQIGANLIDQYDTDSYPTRIVFDSVNTANYEIDGVECLPYISRIWEACQGHRPPPVPPATVSSGNGAYGVWYIPEVWNPHSTTEQGAPSPGPSPTMFKYTVNGTRTTPGTTFANFGGIKSPPQPFPAISGYQPADGDGITFQLTLPTDLQNPTVLQPDQPLNRFQVPQLHAKATGLNAGTSFSNPAVTTPTQSLDNLPFVGICVGLLTSDIPSTAPPAAYVVSPITHQLWYQLGNSWVAYDRIRSVVNGAGSNVAGLSGTNNPLYDPFFNAPEMVVYWERSDPRTSRFGAIGFRNGAADTIPLGFTPVPGGAGPPQFPAIPPNQIRIPAMRSGTGADPAAWIGTQPALGWTYGSTPFSPQSCSPYALSNNDPNLSVNHGAANTYYADPDGVIRLAAGAYTAYSVPSRTLSVGGYPLNLTTGINSTQSRPIILNRPFRSVADMGYAFRDEPWKEIDFFTAQSPDAALLDLFCLNEAPKPPTPANTTDPVPAIAEAGRIDLNTRNQAVLMAVLDGAMKLDETNTSLTSSDANTLATSLVTLTNPLTGGGPLLDRSELVTRWVGSATFPLLSNTSIIKRQREAAVRALADVGNTRTWNLLIDVIAQSGRFIAAGGTDLNKQFMVEGERRYWLHVAIDRYTGKVIAQSLEPVYE